MMESLHPYLNTLVLLVFILTLSVGYLITHLPNRYGVKFVAIPLVFIIFFMSINFYSDNIGRPLHGFPTTSFIYKDHRAVRTNNGIMIELWVIDKEGSRLYQFPYNEQTMKKLAEANSKSKKGMPQQGKVKKRDDKKGNRHFEIEFIDIRVESTLPPKDPVENQ